MRVRTKGTPDKISVMTCREAVQFYGDYLLGPKLGKQVSLRLEFLNTDELGRKNLAFCFVNGKSRVPRSFVIQVKKNMGRRRMLSTLAHEMIHLKQYAKGELIDHANSDRTSWRSKLIDALNPRSYGVDDIDYWESPWEIEAFGRELGLAVKFIKVLRERAKANKTHYR